MLPLNTLWVSRLKHYYLLCATLTPIIKNFLIYAGGALILRSMSIITAPITMRLVSPAEYGTLALINSFISIACIVVGLGLRQALSIEYFHHQNNRRAQLVLDIIATYSFITLPWFVLAVWFYKDINYYCLFNAAPDYLIILSIGIIALYFFTELIYQLLQYEEKAQQLMLLQTSIALITIALNFILLVYGQCGIASIVIGQFISMNLVWLCVVYRYMNAISLRACTFTSWLKMKSYISAGLPFIPSMFCAWLLAAGDRWVLARYATLHEVGIYSVADMFGQLFQMVVLLPFSNAYLPYVMKKFAENHNNIFPVERTNRMVMWLCMVGFVLLAVIGYLIAKPLITFLLPPKYHEALSHILLLIIGYIFLLASYFPAALIQFHKKTYFLAFALCVPALANIGLNFLLIPSYGITGCVMATAIAYALYFFIMLMANHYVLRRTHHFIS